MIPPTADPTALALHARAVQLAQPLEHVHDDRVELLVLEVGGRQVAVPVGELREVLAPGPVVRVPGSPPELAGLAGRHGEGVAAASLAALLGLRTAVPADEQWLAVLDDPVAPLGLLADAAVDIVTVSRGDLSPPPTAEGPVAALVPGGALVLATAALLRDPRLFLDPSDPAKECS